MKTDDPAFVQTPDDAHAILRDAVPGARVSVRRPPMIHWAQGNTDRTRVYDIRVPRLGRNELIVTGSYSLPIEADALAKHARDEVEKRWR